MNEELKSQIKQTLSTYSTEAYSCLYPPDSYVWGCGNKEYLNNTIELMNKILKGIPPEAWTEDQDEASYFKVGKWHLHLNWVDGKMGANLCYSGDDHTAWVVKKGNKFVNFDIGGS